MELFPTRPRLRLTRRFWLGAAVVVLLGNGLTLAMPPVFAWLGGPTRPNSYAVSADRVEPRVLSISARPAPPCAVSARPHPWQRVILLAAVNSLLVAGLAFFVVARYLEELRRYRLCLPTGFDERRLKRRHQRPAGLELSSSSGSRFHRFDPAESDQEFDEGDHAPD